MKRGMGHSFLGYLSFYPKKSMRYLVYSKQCGRQTGSAGNDHEDRGPESVGVRLHMRIALAQMAFHHPH
jgi:hypothetical protein